MHIPVLEMNAQALEKRSEELDDAIYEGFDVRWLEDTSRESNACEEFESICAYSRVETAFALKRPAQTQHIQVQASQEKCLQLIQLNQLCIAGARDGQNSEMSVY